MPSTDAPDTPAEITTPCGLRITCAATPLLDADAALAALATRLDTHRGVLLRSGTECPGRYSRWELGFADPPLSLEGRGRRFAVRALNERGRVPIAALAPVLAEHPELSDVQLAADAITGQVPAAGGTFAEEARTRQPSLLTVVRAVRDALATPEDAQLGLFGAFGYDLVFQLDDVVPRLPRAAGQRDLVLYLPDRLVVVDRHREHAVRLDYELSCDVFAQGQTTAGLKRETAPEALAPPADPVEPRDHAPGEYARVVQRARERFAAGDLFEAVPGQLFRRRCESRPSQVFERLCGDNPAPYGFLMNLGGGEHLVGASPEMFVRVQDGRVESCPIAGTVARGADALGDAAQIKQLIASVKEESELTMCTDVDRNDKARVCEPGSVRVIGRRQLELYSRLIHTVDHVEGRLRAECDALDAFATHCWAVTVTGAPKLDAMQFIEDHERSPRGYYGGAVGKVGLDGSLNTGLTLRTMRIANGVAEVRAGATLLFDSEPAAEEAETELKASALLAALSPDERCAPSRVEAHARPGEGLSLLLIDHRDSFIHTLGDYFRQSGARVTTLRAGFAESEYDRLAADLVVLSPGPGRPADFALDATLAALRRRGLPTFGVCLGLQAMVEHFGGRLSTLATPVHGKASPVRVLGGTLFRGLPQELAVGRYHSLYAEREQLPACLTLVAESLDDQVVMAVEHRELPMAAVQFHPESILSAGGGLGARLTDNAVTLGRRCRPRRIA